MNGLNNKPSVYYVTNGTFPITLIFCREEVEEACKWWRRRWRWCGEWVSGSRTCCCRETGGWVQHQTGWVWGQRLPVSDANEGWSCFTTPLGGKTLEFLLFLFIYPPKIDFIGYCKGNSSCYSCSSRHLMATFSWKPSLQFTSMPRIFW